MGVTRPSLARPSVLPRGLIRGTLGSSRTRLTAQHGWSFTPAAIPYLWTVAGWYPSRKYHVTQWPLPLISTTLIRRSYNRLEMIPVWSTGWVQRSLINVVRYLCCRGQNRAGMTSTWGRTPFGSQTPMIGGVTPSYGGGGGRTPMYGSQTPLQIHGGEGEVVVGLPHDILPGGSFMSLCFDRWTSLKLRVRHSISRSFPDPSTRGECVGPQRCQHTCQVSNFFLSLYQW